MKRWLYISLMALTFCAGIVVGKIQTPQTGSERKLHENTLAKKTAPGLEVSAQGPAQLLSKAYPDKSSKRENASSEKRAEEDMVSAKQSEEVPEVLHEIIDEQDMAAEEDDGAVAPPIEAYQLEELRFSMEDAGVPEEEIKEALEDLASGGVDDSASGWYYVALSEEEIEAEEIESLMDAGVPLEDIEQMMPPSPPEPPPDENWDVEEDEEDID